MLGSRIATEWRQLAATPTEELAARAAPYIRTGIVGLAAQAGGFALLLLHFLLTGHRNRHPVHDRRDGCEGSATFWAAARGRPRREFCGSRRAGDPRRRAGRRRHRNRSNGRRGPRSLRQRHSVCGPAHCRHFHSLHCAARAGPCPGSRRWRWLYWTGDATWGTVLLVWTVLVGAMDNVLRPILIKRGADLPLLLIFAGVIGGLVGFGIIGLFVGPVVLAVTYRLLEAWVADIDRAARRISVRGIGRDFECRSAHQYSKQKHFHETPGHGSSIRCVCNRSSRRVDPRLALAIC